MCAGINVGKQEVQWHSNQFPAIFLAIAPLLSIRNREITQVNLLGTLTGVVFLIYANEATQNSQMKRVDYSSATTPRAVSRVIVTMQAGRLPRHYNRHAITHKQWCITNEKSLGRLGQWGPRAWMFRPARPAGSHKAQLGTCLPKVFCIFLFSQILFCSISNCATAQ